MLRISFSADGCYSCAYIEIIIHFGVAVGIPVYDMFNLCRKIFDYTGLVFLFLVMCPLSLPCSCIEEKVAVCM